MNFFSLSGIANQINFPIFATLLRIFQKFPQLNCGFFKNFRNSIENFDLLCTIESLT